MRRRDFAIGLLLAAATQSVPAEERRKQHRIAIVITAGCPTSISATGNRIWQAFFEELRRLGDVEGQNLIVERYSGEGRPEGYADLFREVVNRNPDLIVAFTAVAQPARAIAVSAPIPIVVSGDPIGAGLVTNLARPGGNITGVSIFAGYEIYGKRLQILKEAIPSASKVAFLEIPASGVENAVAQQLRELSERLGISLIDMPLQRSAPSEYQRAFAEIAQERPDAITVSVLGDLLPYRQLIVELAEKSRLPAVYPYRDYVEAGGLMAYGSDLGQLWRRVADDVHQILNGAKPGDIPIYQPTKFEFVVNLKAAKALRLTLPPALLVAADEVIE
jgi:putative ABC transport system substrate-binding protein